MQLAKCTLTCDKSINCCYAISDGVEMGFKEFCKEQSRYTPIDKDFVFGGQVNKSVEEERKLVDEGVTDDEITKE